MRRDTREIAKRLGARLREARLLQGLTQKELGRRLGRDYSAVAHWETGRHRPPSDMLPRIAHELQCRVEALLGQGPSDSAPSAALVGALDADGRVMPSEAILLPLHMPGVIAYRFLASCHWPVYRPGDVILTGDQAERCAGLIGTDALVEISEKRLLLRRLMPAGDAMLVGLSCYAITDSVTVHGDSAAWQVIGLLREAAFSRR